MKALRPKQRSVSAAGGPHNKRPWFYVCSKTKMTANGRCIGAAILCETVDSLVWREACKLIRDESYLRSLLAKSDDVW
jgi:hypothetical protein